MPSDIIPIGFGIVPTKIGAKKQPGKGAKHLTFSLSLSCSKLLKVKLVESRKNIPNNFVI